MSALDEAAARARLTRLWRSHAPDVRRFLARRLGTSTSAHDVEDLLSDTFAVVWRRIDDLPTGERPWIFGVARNLAMTHLRDEGRRHALLARLGSEAAYPEGGDPEQIVLSRAALTAAWRALPTGDREAIALVAWDGLDNHEAAQVLGCRPSTYAERLHRARHRLLRLLDLAGGRPAGLARQRSSDSDERTEGMVTT